MTFENLNLIEPILKALRQEGYTSPTPIQEQSIPILLQGKDLLGCAQTGTGKTAAFSIPILQKLYKTDHRKGIKALVLTPTRELAIQIGESFEAYGRYTGLKHAVIFGGVGQKPQTDALRGGIQILVATPGRLLDLISQGFVSLNSLDFFVLDEADRMLDMGFIHDIKRILKLLPTKRQTLFFSATMPPEIETLANSMLRTTRAILDLLKKVNRELGITIVVITHEMQVIKDICDRVAVMKDGQVVETGTVFDIFANPKEQITREFVENKIGRASCRERVFRAV